MRGSLNVIYLPIKVRPSATVFSRDRRWHFQRQEGYECDECSRTKPLDSDHNLSNARKITSTVCDWQLDRIGQYCFSGSRRKCVSRAHVLSPGSHRPAGK
jgi:hypothetical protein